MERTTTNALVDAVALAALVLAAATGGVLRYVLPPGSGAARLLWGLNRHAWGDVHFWLAAALLTAMALHLALHWCWIACVVTGGPGARRGLRTTLALLGLVALVVLATAPFLGRVERIEGASGGEHGAGHGTAIDGSMTLREVQERTGVPASVILKELGMPGDTPQDEQLGRLRAAHGFELHDVRAAVKRHAVEP